MFEQINELYTTFLAFSRENPVASGAISLWGLGVLTFFLKIVPLQVFNFLKRQLTTSLTVNSQDEVYYDLLRWLSFNKMHSFVRTLHLNNQNRFGFGEASISIGYGLTFFWFGGRLLFINRQEIEANQTEYSKERVTVTLLGRNHEVFNKLFDTVKKQNEDGRYFTIYNYDERWKTLSRQFKREMDTVFIPDKTKNRLIKHVERFYASEDWYRKNGLPYRTGVLLKGPPGTGKTSIIKALCSKYDKDLYLIDLTSMSDKALLNALAKAPEGAIIAIEDIDTIHLENRGREKRDEDKSGALNGGLLTLGGVLNAIDGVASNENRIIIATTNYPEKLDAALLREGRFDLSLNIGYMTDETLKKYLKRFFANHNFDGIKVQPKIAPCKLQQLIFERGDDVNYILDEVAEAYDKSETETVTERLSKRKASEDGWVDCGPHRMKVLSVDRDEYIVEYPGHVIYYYKNGLYHREGGPAIERSGGTQFWCKNGRQIK